MADWFDYLPRQARIDRLDVLRRYPARPQRCCVPSSRTVVRIDPAPIVINTASCPCTALSTDDKSSTSPRTTFRLGRFTGWILIPRRQGDGTGTALHGHAGAPTKVGSQIPCCLLPAGQNRRDFTAYKRSLCSTSRLSPD
jgi:hypothetical protein